MSVVRIHHARGPIRIVSIADDRALDDAVWFYAIDHGVRPAECTTEECAA